VRGLSAKRTAGDFNLENLPPDLALSRARFGAPVVDLSAVPAAAASARSLQDEPNHDAGTQRCC
jgi:hypothetical protein